MDVPAGFSTSPEVPDPISASTWEGTQVGWIPNKNETDWMQVFYKDLCQNAEETMRLVYEHLCVPFHPVSYTPGWGAVKLDPRSLSQAIENYGELKSHFMGTPWQEFFVE